MRTLFLSALVGASISFASYTVQANQTWQAPSRGHTGTKMASDDHAVYFICRHHAEWRQTGG